VNIERPTILLIEDSEDDIELTMRALRKSKLLNDIVVKRDGEQGLAYLRDAAQENSKLPLPQLILLDVNLPRMNGHEVVKMIRSDPRIRLIPIVMLTSSALDEDIVRSYEEGVNSYVRKPLNLAEFTEAVQQLQMYWLLLNQAPRELP
jgi:two-component system, response regulator